MILQMIDRILAGLPDNARLRSELDELRKEMALLSEENSILKAKVSDLESKLAAVEKHEEIDDQSSQILNAIFDSRDGLTTEEVAGRFPISESEAESHFDVLEGCGFVVKIPASYSFKPPIPVSAEITKEGRAHIMRSRKRV